MTPLGLKLLGPLQIELKGEPLDLKRRKALALLIYLAVSGERQRRDSLATLFWPESSQHSARKALRRDLSELNLALSGEWLDVDRESVGLRAGFWLDVTEFQHHITDEIPDPQSLIAAVNLYRGDFLTGFTLPDCPAFDEWQFFQSEGLRQSLASALEKLVVILGDQDDYETAIPYARRWLALDPLYEPAHRQLMQLYVQTGQQAAALRQYELCRQTLEDELGIPPSDETTTLYQAIRSGSLSHKPVPVTSIENRKPVLNAVEGSKIVNRHNLPTQTTSFIGRTDELTHIKRLLLDEPDCRLLTLVGPGGIGKTRLALAVAGDILDAFPDEAYFVSLASISEVGDMVPTIAEALRFTFYGSTDPKTQLLDYLSQKQLLLVVDNVEHLLAGADLLSEILHQAPNVTLLATSRERLHLQEEWGYEVRGLVFPVAANQTSEVFKTSEVLSPYSAVELFLQRSRQAEASFVPSAEEMADIGRICQLVEGMPLGLELAAPWIRTLSCGEIAAEIERSLDFLTTPLQNVPERHRSLRVVFEQTWNRLSQEEQTVLMQLSVFRGGCTREAAEAVTGATLPVLSSLVDRALLRRTNLGRYQLHELIRQFAEVQLQTDPKAVEQAQKRHGDYFTAFLEGRTIRLKGHEQKETLAAIRAEMDNVRLVWRQAVANRDAEAIDRSAECLLVYYTYGSGHYEGQVAFQQAVAAFTAIPDPPRDDVQSQALIVLDHQENLVGFLLAVQSYFLARSSGGQVLPEQIIARLLQTKPGNRRRESVALAFLSRAISYQGRIADSRPYAELGMTLASETGDLLGEWLSLLMLGGPHIDSQPAKAEQFLKRALVVCQKSGDPSALGFSFHNLGHVSMELGKYREAGQYIEQTIITFGELDNIQGLGDAFEGAGKLATSVGDYTGAIQNFRQALAYYDEARSMLHTNHCRVWLSLAFRLQGDYQQAEQISQQALVTFKAINDPLHTGYCLLNLGCLAQDQGDLARAEQLQQEALKIWQQIGQEARVADASGCLGHLMVASGEQRYNEARKYFRQALELSTKHQVAPLVLDVCVGVAQLLAHTGEVGRAVELLALTEQHEASTFETKEKARQLLAEWEDRLPPATLRAARATGQKLDWHQTATRLIDELQQAELAATESLPRLDRPRHNLPTQTTSFIGRADELAHIKRLLLDEPDCRLLTLVGPGGIGKTRLALAVAGETLEAFPDEVYFVSLAPVSEVGDIVPVIAEALRFTFYGSADPKDQLLDYLSQKTLLLVVDNFEHLLAGTKLLSEILSHAPNVTLLATSRERLNLKEEWGYEVRGLVFPVAANQTSEILKTSEVLSPYSAVELFLQRARQAEASFTPSAAEMADIGRICQLVEGMPLGLELAAPWIRTLSCREIAAEIERSLDFLTTPLQNVPERHRSLRVVFEQTWGRLSQAEQSVLQQLSVFRGGCTREAAEQVTGATLLVLASLVDKALLRRTNTGRYELHELIRQFAETQLQMDLKAVDQIQQRHREFFITFLEARTAGVKGRRQLETLAEIEVDIDNVRLAWRGVVTNREAEAIERSAECLFVYYLYRNGYDEGQSEFRRAVAALAALPDAQADGGWLQDLVVSDQKKNLVGFLLAGLGYFVAHRRNLQEGQIILEQALALLRRTEPGDRRKEAFALLWLGWALYFQGELIEGKRYATESLTLLTETADHWGEGWALLLLGLCLREGRPAEAEAVFQTGLTLCRESGDQIVLSYLSLQMGNASKELGRYAQAQQHIDLAVTISEKVDNILGLGYSLLGRGRLEIPQGKYRQASQTLQQALTYFNKVGTVHASTAQIYLGLAHHLQGDYDLAAQLYGQALEGFKAANSKLELTRCLNGLGHLAYDQGKLHQAEQYQRESLALLQETAPEPALVAATLRYLGQVMVASGEHRHAEAKDYFRQALELATEHQLAPIALDVCVSVAQLLAQAEERNRAVELLALAEQHEASTFETRQKARHHLIELGEQVPPEMAQAAQDKEQPKDLWATVRTILPGLTAEDSVPLFL